jgi:hypothetical protein
LGADHITAPGRSQRRRGGFVDHTRLEGVGVLYAPDRDHDISRWLRLRVQLVDGGSNVANAILYLVFMLVLLLGVLQQPVCCGVISSFSRRSRRID